MTLPLTKPQIEAIQAKNLYCFTPDDIPALCQMALRAIELEADLVSWQDMHSDSQGCSEERYREIQRLQSQLAATRKALEEERERCARVAEVGTCNKSCCAGRRDIAARIRALPAPEVKK